MNLQIKRVVAVVSLTIVASLLASTSLFAQAQRGGTLRMVFYLEPSTLNPGITSSLPTQLITTKIFNGLLEYDWKFQPTPSLAERWTVSPDGLTYTFYLRKGVVFHDGKPLTSEDVKFSLVDVLPKYHPRAGIFLRTLDRVETPDPHIAVVVLKKPSPALGRLLFGADAPILPKHVYAGDDIRKNPHNITPIGSGPFKFVEWVKGSHVSLVRNDKYWRAGLPHLDKLIVQFIPDQASRVAVMETGDGDLAPWSAIPNFEVARLSKLPHLRVETGGFEAYSAMNFIEINGRKPPFNKVKVRQAVAHALDRQFIARNIWFGLGRPASGPVSSAVKEFFNPDLPHYAYDLKKAERLLDEAGFSRGRDGVRFRTTQFYNLSGDEYVRLAEYIRSQMAKIGVVVTTEPLDFPTWLNRMFSLVDYDMSTNWTLNYADPVLLERLYTTRAIRKGVPFSNSMGYSNAEVDDLFDRAAVEFDPAKRAVLYQRAQAILVQEVPVVWLLELQFTSVLKRNLEKVITSPWGILDTFEQVYWKRDP